MRQVVFCNPKVLHRMNRRLYDYLKRTSHDRKCEMGHIVHILKSKLHTVILINLCVGLWDNFVVVNVLDLINVLKLAACLSLCAIQNVFSQSCCLQAHLLRLRPSEDDGNLNLRLIFLNTSYFYVDHEHNIKFFSLRETTKYFDINYTSWSSSKWLHPGPQDFTLSNIDLNFIVY